MISEKFYRVKRIGITPEVHESDVQHIMIVNSFSFIIAILCFFYGLGLSLISGVWIIQYSALIFVAGFLTPLLLNRLHYYTAAKVFLPVNICCLVLYYGQLFGEITEVHLLCFFLIGVPLLIFNKKEALSKFICMLLPILSLVLLEINNHYLVFEPYPFPADVANIFRWLIMAVILLLNCVIISFYQSNINTLINTLGIRNTALTRSRDEIELQKLQLKDAYHQLEEYNNNLEDQVAARTEEINIERAILQSTFADLKISYDKLSNTESNLMRQVFEIERTKSNLQVAKNQAEASNRAKTQFLHEISHEIRNPLNAIIGITDLILNHEAEEHISPYARNLIENISTSGKTLLGIVNGVLDMAKIESGKRIEVVEEKFDCHQWIESVLNVAMSLAESKGVKLEYSIGRMLPRYLSADKKLLTQVLNNLVGNAVKFTPRGKSVYITADLSSTLEWFIKIEDEGPGIPEDKLEAIFDPFEQADATVSREYGGTGLGLSISLELMTVMGGAIAVSSKLGEGSTFKISMPCVTTVDIEELFTASVPVEVVQEGMPRGKRILLMEDNKVNQMLIKRYCESMGLLIEMAGDGEEGILMALERKPDLILMDLHMPKLNGLETMLRLRAMPNMCKIPIIAISADAFKDQQAAALEQGFNDYLVKPVEYNMLYLLMLKYLSMAVPAKAGKDAQMVIDHEDSSDA